MAKQVAEIEKSFKKHKDNLVKEKKNFKGDGKIDVVNQLSTMDDKLGSFNASTKSLVDAKNKLDDNVKAVAQADADMLDFQKKIDALKANKTKLEKDQDNLRKGIKDSMKSYNDALNVVKTTANVAKDLITRNKLNDKTKDTKTADFAGVLGDVKDIGEIRELPI